MSASNPTVVYKELHQFPGYRVGSDGSVWSQFGPGQPRNTGIWRELKSWIPKSTGRPQVRFYGKSHSVHRLILLAFVGPCPDGMQACHNDGNKLNNIPSNLRWDTPQRNQQDRVAHGTHCRGERNKLSKYKSITILAIRAGYADGMTLDQLSSKHGMPRDYVRDIVNGRAWKHLL